MKKTIIEDNIEYKIYRLPFFTEEDIRNDSKKKEYMKKINQ